MKEDISKKEISIIVSYFDLEALRFVDDQISKKVLGGLGKLTAVNLLPLFRTMEGQDESTQKTLVEIKMLVGQAVLLRDVLSGYLNEVNVGMYTAYIDDIVMTLNGCIVDILGKYIFSGRYTKHVHDKIFMGVNEPVSTPEEYPLFFEEKAKNRPEPSTDRVHMVPEVVPIIDAMMDAWNKTIPESSESYTLHDAMFDYLNRVIECCLCMQILYVYNDWKTFATYVILFLTRFDEARKRLLQLQIMIGKDLGLIPNDADDLEDAK